MRSQVVTLLTGLAMGESPRWHNNRLWLADWGAREILAVDEDGRRHVVVRTPFELPFCIDWLPDGRLLIVAGRENRVVRMEPDGTLDTYVDLRSISDKVVRNRRGWSWPWVRQRRFRSYRSRECRWRDARGGRRHRISEWDGITPDNGTLIIAESHGKKLTAFEIDSDGLLSNRRIWAELGNGVPDGICIDQEGAVWYADVPNKCCVRVREGGEVLQTIHVDRGCFACMLGGRDRRTLFIVAAEWRGMKKIPEIAQARTGQLLAVEAPTPGAGWP